LVRDVLIPQVDACGKAVITRVTMAPSVMSGLCPLGKKPKKLRKARKARKS
jgi:hypothetical protein